MTSISQQFREAFAHKGYQELEPAYEATDKEVGFAKDRVLIEVQFGKHIAILCDMARFQYFYSENKAEVGVEIVPCHALYREMSSGVSYGEKLIYDVEKLRRHFPAVPIKVILIDVDEPD